MQLIFHFIVNSIVSTKQRHMPCSKIINIIDELYPLNSCPRISIETNYYDLFKKSQSQLYWQIKHFHKAKSVVNLMQ